MKIVADTNVILSTLLWRKQLAPLFDLINRRKVRLCFSPETIKELYKVSGYAKIVQQAEKIKLDHFSMLDNLITQSEIVQPRGDVFVIKEDPSDNKFLSCALAARADFIVSGDKHLLKLKSFLNIPIITPRQFLNRSAA